MARFPTPLSHIGEKGLPQPVSASGARRPRRRRFVMIGMLAFIGYVLYCSSQDGAGRVARSLPDFRKLTNNGVQHVEHPVPSKAHVGKTMPPVVDEKAAMQKALAEKAKIAAEKAKAHKAQAHKVQKAAAQKAAAHKEAQAAHANKVAPNAAGKPGSGDAAYIPTDALREFSDKIGEAVPPAGAAMPAHGAKLASPPAAHPVDVPHEPSHADRVLLLLSAAKDKAYKFPSDAQRWLDDWHFTSLKDFAGMLNRVRGESLEDDAKLYLDSHDAWLAKHRKASPLTVFSKSYCPYSKKAKALLTEMGVDFDVYDVDLRQDGPALQRTLREVSGHTTFPTIFLGDKLIGGSDDLSSLSSTGMLRGVLQGGGVTFSATKPKAEAEVAAAAVPVPGAAPYVHAHDHAHDHALAH